MSKCEACGVAGPLWEFEWIGDGHILCWTCCTAMEFADDSIPVLRKLATYRKKLLGKKQIEWKRPARRGCGK